jgi:hypothetical protein
MSIRFASVVVIPVVLIAGALALHGVERAPDAIASAHAASPAPAAGGDGIMSENGESLPPDHPPIGAGMSPPIGAGMSPHGSLPPAAEEAPALAWTVPAGWQEAPNPNAVRLATYHVPGGVEVSVSRAGGGTEANIQRWTAQFDDAGHEGRVEKTVHGLHVVTVDVSGTFVGGGMGSGGGMGGGGMGSGGAMARGMSAPAQPHPGWAMVGAIVETSSLPYFFKMTGPAAAIHTARPAFDRLVGSVAPVGG